jgi:pimeloyl-ACP methyl ester carboxylesterase
MKIKKAKKNIVLIHGAWHGSWCWERVEDLLQSQANVYVLDLPGRIFEASSSYKKITLQDYVKTVEACLLSFEGPAILVGHSMAGLVISQVAEHYPEKIQALIYMTAFIPCSGESMFDITQTFPEPGIASELMPDPLHNKMNIRKSEATFAVFYHCCSPEWGQKALSRLSPEPLRAFNTPVTLTPERFGKVEKQYIKCMEDRALLNSHQDEMIKKTNITKVYELFCDHSPFFSQPEQLVVLLERIAALKKVLLETA